jgi:hypothetical protein
MVVRLIGIEGDAGHEAKSSVKVLELERTFDGFASFDQGPAVELGDMLIPHFLSELLEGHRLCTESGRESQGRTGSGGDGEPGGEVERWTG